MPLKVCSEGFTRLVFPKISRTFPGKSKLQKPLRPFASSWSLQRCPAPTQTFFFSTPNPTSPPNDLRFSLNLNQLPCEQLAMRMERELFHPFPNPTLSPPFPHDYTTKRHLSIP